MEARRRFLKSVVVFMPRGLNAVPSSEFAIFVLGVEGLERERCEITSRYDWHFYETPVCHL